MESPFFDRAAGGATVIKQSLRVITTFPILLLPIFICWVFWAAGTLYFEYRFPWQMYSLSARLLFAFLIITGFTLLYSIAAFMLLEFLQQLERGRPFSSSRAIGKTIFRDIPMALPIILIWAFIDFLLMVINAVVSSLSRDEEGDKEGDEQFTLESAAKTLAGYDDFSLWNLTIGAMEKGIRMITFLIFPAIAWESISPFKAIKKGFGVLKAHPVEFVSGYVTTLSAAVIIFLPPGLLFYLSDKFHWKVPDPVWVVTIIYCGIGWSFYLYLEQTFTALLYLWNMKWEKEVLLAEKEGRPTLSLQDVRQPSFLDNIADLN